MNEAGLWLIPVMMVLIVAGAFLLVRWWIRQSQSVMTGLGSNLRRFSSEMKRLEAEASEFTVEQRHPYSDPATELAGELEGIARLLQSHTQLYTETRQAMRNASISRYDALMRAPVAWYQIRKQIRQLNHEDAQLAEAISAADKRIEALQRLGWLVAERAREAHDRLEKASDLAHELRAQGLTGSAFQEAIRLGGRLRGVIQSIPAYFFASQPEEVLAQADKEAIIQVEELLAGNRPALDDLLTRLQNWQRQLEESKGYLDSYRKSIDDLRGVLQEPPPGLQLERVETRLQQLEQAAADLRNRLAAPDAEDLRSILAEARKSSRTAKSDVQQVGVARQKLSELQAVIAEANSGIESIQNQMLELERKEHYPLNWDISRPGLAHLQQQSAAIGTRDQNRVPEQVAKDLIAAQALTGKVKELDQTVKASAGRYARLVPLLDALDPKVNAELYQTARHLAGQVGVWGPENWPRQDAVPTYEPDVTQLLDQVKQVVPPEPGAVLLESKLVQQLETAENASTRYQQLKTRTESIKARLEQLDQLEIEAEQELNHVVNLLNQVDLLSQSNAVLAQASARSETNRLWQEGQRYADDLFQAEKRKQGSVEKKTRKVDAFYKRVEGAANTWLTRLQTDYRARREELAEKLNRLRSIAQLDDPILLSAERLLAEASPVPEVSSAKPEPRPLTEAMTEIKRLNDDWQRIAGLLRGIENEVESEVIQAYQTALSQRQETINRLQQAESELPDGRDWPPTLQNLDEARQTFEETDSQWEGLHGQPMRSNRLILMLGEITRGYQTTHEVIDRTLERAEAERDRVRALEHSINESISLWQFQANQHRESEETQESIQRLLEDTQRSQESLQRQYVQGSKPYHQVEQELRSLSKRINNAQVPVASGARIDINGEERVGSTH